MLIELSTVLNEKIAKWPTNPSERFETLQCMGDGDACNASSVYHSMHNGTHVDAPKHFSKNGKSIDNIPIEDFYYTSPLLITLKKGEREYITKEDLVQFEKEISKADILCVYTGFSDVKEKDTDAYVTKFPSFTYEAALYLRYNFPALKAIALDFLSADSPTEGPATGFPVHKALLDEIKSEDIRTLLIFEDVNLNRLMSIKDTIKTICAFPIRWENAEAAPVCMVAIS